MNKTLLCIIFVILSFVSGCYLGWNHHSLTIPVADTIVVHDTTKVYLPQIVERKSISTQLARLPKFVWVDLPEGTNPDSVEVAVPMERVVYEEPEFRAVIEGYNPRLVEIDVYPKLTTITQNIPAKHQGWDFGIGPTICWGITKDGFRWCFGLGATATYHF